MYEISANWEEKAYCRLNGIDTNVFFPEHGDGVELAKAICRGCVVIDDCFETALEERQDHGVWGGASERERRRELRRRRIRAEQLVY